MIYYISIMAAGLFIYGLTAKKKGTLHMSQEESDPMGVKDEDVLILNPLDHEKLMEEIFDQEEFLLLRKRMEDLEGTLFKNILSWQEEKERLLERVELVQADHVLKMNEFKEKLDRDHENELKNQRNGESQEKKVLVKKEMPPHIRAVVDYEKEGKSLQEIAVLTKMNKGEVLLLRNLSKHYEA